MFCTKCGASINDTDTVCPSCNSMIMQIYDASEKQNSQENKWEKYQQEKDQLKAFGFNKFLAWSVATCLCCVPFGLINIILLHYNVKPLLKEGKTEEANKLKGLMIALIVSGFILSFIYNVFTNIIPLIGNILLLSNTIA